MYLFDFESIRPPFETSQEEALAWTIEAHAKSENKEGFRKEFEEKIWKVGCKPEYISKRGHVLDDFLHQNWDEMKVYRLNDHPAGKDLSVRAKIFEEEADKIFARYYPDGAVAPDDLIHVSCTGYVSPSPAQKIVSQRGWGATTTVTHAYHMGCYGSIPAIRMGQGFIASGKSCVDIVHTEICSLHINPSMHALDQLVSQTLFADGFMKYSVVKKGSGLKVLSVREEIIPDSRDAMTWNVMGWGFQMSLTKEVPVYITRYLESYLSRLGVPRDAIFAVHPGGPKILQYVQKTLGLTDAQMKYSYEILKEYGNMSSATLPHIWQRILEDKAVVDGTQVVSLAFGPGLTIAGALMEKSCGI